MDWILLKRYCPMEIVGAMVAKIKRELRKGRGLKLEAL
jgi:hypothetical protein